MALFDMLRLGRLDRPGFTLYTSAVRAARDPFIFSEIAVPDTLDGRFDAIGVHAFLLIRRLQRAGKPGKALAQAVFDAMFSDMDSALREIGVGDLSVGKKVKAMWEAFHGRALAYEAGLTEGKSALAAALARNVWRGAPPESGGAAENGAGAARLAELMLAQDSYLAAQSDGDLLKGEVRFLPARQAAQPEAVA